MLCMIISLRRPNFQGPGLKVKVTVAIFRKNCHRYSVIICCTVYLCWWILIWFQTTASSSLPAFADGLTFRVLTRSCPRKFSETACRISMKLHGNIKYQRWMRISPACSGSMIFPRVIALWWVLHEYIGYCSCPREFSETTSRISLKLHGNIKYGRWMCISPACSGSMIFPRVIALWWVLHEYIGYCSCPRKFLANTGRNSTKF